MKEIQDYIGKRIREARENKQLTQEELGRKVGFSSMGISHFEKGRREIKITDLKKIAECLDVEIGFFLGSQVVAHDTTSLFRASSGESSNDAICKSLDEFDKFLDKKLKNEQ